MSGEPRKCACGCGKELKPRRPWHRYFSATCRKRKFTVRALRRKAKERVLSAAKSVGTVSSEQGGRVMQEVADMRQALEVLARRRPSFYMRLSASCSAALQGGIPSQPAGLKPGATSAAQAAAAAVREMCGLAGLPDPCEADA